MHQAKDFCLDTVDFYKTNPSVLKKELLSGVTVAVLQVPESIAFSFVANVDPIVGLYGTFFMGLVTGLLGGKPGMISGAAGAMAVVMVDIMDDEGELAYLSKQDRAQVLFMCLVFVGLIQILLAVVSAGRLVRLIPETAMIGFMNGLAIIIFMAQLTAFQECNLYDNFSECLASEREWMTLSQVCTYFTCLCVCVYVYAVLHGCCDVHPLYIISAVHKPGNSCDILTAFLLLRCVS